MKNRNVLTIIVIYIFITTTLLIKDNIFFANLIGIIFWVNILIYMKWNIKKFYIRFPRNKKYIISMIIIASVHIIFGFYIGIIFGFSKSPYGHDVLTILKNIILKIIPIIGIEVTRSVVVTRNRGNKKALIFITILLILAEINFSTIINLISNREELFKYVCSIVLPLIATNVLCTYLSLKESYELASVFRIYKETALFILPIIPSVDWFMKGCIGIIYPIIIYIIFKYYIIKEPKDLKQKQKTVNEKISYIVTLILLITLICFMLGMFKYESIAVLSSSMIPTFNRGDVVIFEKFEENKLKEIPVNAIIIYQIENQYIAHRVVEKIEKNGVIAYRTKGDSNNVADMNLVKIEQIQGVYVFNIKYIGFPSVWLHDFFNKEKAKVETK